MQNNPLVYSTESGRIRTETDSPSKNKNLDGIIRIRRETKGRKGKGVTTITGFDLSDDELKLLAKDLKKLCGTGGAIKGDVIEIQGDNREKIKSTLEQRGFQVKLAGG
ncbi:stress response translation initiation inhibitor YciH [Paraneptunicella aestuarii]|uniref:stress response translation initiation inhibitor YciH n=1 Tax=Paraneptunicella aestuarii TaxID=2831148 RepID=UPI001E37D122|nr:stress response translation initiation inhibitor YciH [Paraneptunicella aestuarii]UAA40132.1 stress response translation initiation inhibitor YciH [Paraneptunicella aestuarii]